MLLNLVVIQPIDLCNLNCTYCYVPGRKNKAIMSQNILEATLRCIFNSSMAKTSNKFEKLNLLWHSGEPLTAGIDFYKEALRLIKIYNKDQISVDFEIQSNATLIDQEWCDFILKNDIAIAVSLDGPEFIHDKYRKTWAGKGSHRAVMKGINYLKKNNIDLRAICVLTKDSLDYPEEIYNFFKENGFSVLCFNIEEKEGINNQSSYNVNEVVAKKFQYFMSTVYDLWEKDNRKIRIREFDKILQKLNYRKTSGFSRYIPNSETLAFSIATVTKDGNISLFSPELSGGTADDPKKFIVNNVLNINSLDDLINNEQFLSQLNSVKKGVEKCAAECSYFDFCGGGSPSNKYYENGSFETTETTQCIFTQKILFDLVMEKLAAYNPIYTTN